MPPFITLTFPLVLFQFVFFAGSDRDLESRLRSARQRVQDGQWRPEGCNLVWPGDPTQEQGLTIV